MLIASSASDTQKQMAKNLGQSGSGSTTTAMPVTSGIPNYESQARPQSPTAIPASVQQGVSNGVKAAGQAIGGAPVSAQPVAAQQTTAQPSNGGYPGQLTTAQIAAEAQARIDKQRAALLNAVTGAKTGAKNTYDYTQGLQKDNRALEDAQFQRNSNPFSGGTDYKTAMVNRDRQIADTASSKDYNNVIAGYDAQVASFDTLAPEQQQAAINEMTRIERQYGLDLGSLTGNFNGQQTLAAKTAQQNYDLGLSQQSGQLPGGGQTLQAQQQAYNQSPTNPNNVGQSIQNQLAQYQLDNYPAEAKAKATLLEQQVKSGALSNEAATYNLQQLKDPKSAVNQAQALDLQMKQIDAKNYSQESQLKLQQLKKQIADIGVIHKAPQTQAEKDMDQLQIQKITAEISNLNNKADAPKAVDPKDSTDNLTFYQGQIDSRPNLTKDQRLSYAAGQKAGLSASDYAKLIDYINKYE